MYKTLSSAILAGALALTGTSASATGINLDQNGANANGGSISYNVKGFSLNGNAINFNVAGFPDSSSLECRGCELNFTSSSLKSQQGSIYTFIGGGPASVSGALYDGDNRVGSGDTVLSGFLVGDQTVVDAANGLMISSLSGQFTGDEGSLFSYYDSIAGTSSVDANHHFAVTATSTGDVNSDGTFSGDVVNSDLSVEVSAPVSSDVPEPSDIGLFGLGALLIVGGLAFRRRKMPLIG